MEYDTRYRAAEEEFWLMRASRYYAHFGNFWDSVAMAEKLASFSLFCLSGYLHSIGNDLTFASTLAGAVFIMLDLIVRVGTRQKTNWDKQRKFVELRNRILTNAHNISEQLLNGIRKERNIIECNEIVFPCVSVMLHNQIQIERYLRPDYELSFIERTLGQILPLRYQPKPLPHLKEQLEQQQKHASEN